MIALVGATTLAIDVGMLMTARTQAQSAADAGALAGAVALAKDDFNYSLVNGPAVQGAMSVVTAADGVMGAAVAIAPADGTFPSALAARRSRRVLVTRSAARSLAVHVHCGRLRRRQRDGGHDGGRRRRALLANAATCAAPFAIPDRWQESQHAAPDPNDSFKLTATQQRRRTVGHQSIPQSTWASTRSDKGIRPDHSRPAPATNIEPSFYYGLALPLDTGASDYEWNIRICNTMVLRFGQMLTAEPGNMVGPTLQGVEELIAKKEIRMPTGTPRRPRCEQHEPEPARQAGAGLRSEVHEDGKKSGRNADLKAANFIGVFIEGIQSGDVIVPRITPITGITTAIAAGRRRARFRARFDSFE